MPKNVKEDNEVVKENNVVLKEEKAKKTTRKKKTEEVTEEKPKRTRKTSTKTGDTEKKKTTKTRSKKSEPVEVTENLTEVNFEAVNAEAVPVIEEKAVLMPEPVVEEPTEEVVKDDNPLAVQHDEVETTVDSVVTDGNNQEKKSGFTPLNICLCFLLLIMMCYCLKPLIVTNKQVTLKDTSGIRMTVPSKWYGTEANSFFELKEDVLHIRMSYIESSGITEDVKNKFFDDIRTYYEHQEIDDNGIILIETQGEDSIYCFFKYFPERESVIETDFQGVTLEEAQAIWNTLN